MHSLALSLSRQLTPKNEKISLAAARRLGLVTLVCVRAFVYCLSSLLLAFSCGTVADTRSDASVPVYGVGNERLRYQYKSFYSVTEQILRGAQIW